MEIARTRQSRSAASPRGPGLAALLVLPAGQARVYIADARTGQWIREIRIFGELWKAKSITAHDADFDGVSEISVLGAKVDGTAMAQVLNALTGEPVKWISFSDPQE